MDHRSGFQHSTYEARSAVFSGDLVTWPPSEDSEEPKDPEHLAGWEVFEQARGVNPGTTAGRKLMLAQLRRHAGVPLNEVTAREFIAYMASLPATAPSREKKWATSRSYFRWLVLIGHRRDNPTDAVPRPKRRRSVPRPVETAALEQALLHCDRLKAYAFMILGAYAGLRSPEMAKITAEDVDLAGGTLYVRGKGGTEAFLPLHPAIADMASWLPAEGFWFPAMRGHCTGSTVGRVVRVAFAAVGVKAHTHQLRHWFATQVLIASGGDLSVTQALMRRVYPESTWAYTRVGKPQLRRALYGLPGTRAIGGTYPPLPPDVISRRALIPPPKRVFTYRQTEVLSALMSGMMPRQVGEHLGITQETVYDPIQQMRSKVGARRNAELPQLAVAGGWLPPDDFPLGRPLRLKGEPLVPLARPFTRARNRMSVTNALERTTG